MCPWLPKPEEPLHAYSTSELEQWMVNRIRARNGWNSATPPRHRQMGRGQFGGIFLIPGGRWLLTRPIAGVVIVYDLDTPEMKSKTLISPMDDLDIHRASQMAISIDDRSPTLKFDVALASGSFAGPLGQGTEPRLRMWRVILSGHGQNAELVAEHITSIAIPSLNIPKLISLNGEYLAQMKVDTIEILKWTESTSSTHTLAVIFPEEIPEWICVLPGGKLLSFSSSNMIIYDIPQFKCVSASSDPTFAAITPHSWKIPCCGQDLKMGGISLVWSNDDGVSFTVSTQDGAQA
ncbi:hypothetical protein BD779DRAFT_1574304, partial [Infundibulicybe gibba]